MSLADMTPQQLRDEVERLARINRENCERLLRRDDALSAIRALVQQWREEAVGYRRREYNRISWQAVAMEVERRADQLAALCPVPPEDQK